MIRNRAIPADIYIYDHHGMSQSPSFLAPYGLRLGLCLFQAAYSTASEQPGFLLFQCKQNI